MSIDDTLTVSGLATLSAGLTVTGASASLNGGMSSTSGSFSGTLAATYLNVGSGKLVWNGTTFSLTAPTITNGVLNGATLDSLNVTGDGSVDGTLTIRRVGASDVLSFGSTLALGAGVYGMTSDGALKASASVVEGSLTAGSVVVGSQQWTSTGIALGSDKTLSAGGTITGGSIFTGGISTLQGTTTVGTDGTAVDADRFVVYGASTLHGDLSMDAGTTATFNGNVDVIGSLGISAVEADTMALGGELTAGTDLTVYGVADMIGGLSQSSGTAASSLYSLTTTNKLVSQGLGADFTGGGIYVSSSRTHGDTKTDGVRIHATGAGVRALAVTAGSVDFSATGVDTILGTTSVPSGKELTIASGGTIDVVGSAVFEDDVSLEATAALTVDAGASVDVHAFATLDGGVAISGSSVSIGGTSLTFGSRPTMNAGLTIAGGQSITGGSWSGVGLTASGTAQLSGGVNVTGDIAVTSGSITGVTTVSAGTYNGGTVSVSGGISSTGSGTISTGGAVNGGTVAASGAVSGGSLSSGGTLSVSGASTLGLSGTTGVTRLTVHGNSVMNGSLTLDGSNVIGVGEFGGASVNVTGEVQGNSLVSNSLTVATNVVVADADGLSVMDGIVSFSNSTGGENALEVTDGLTSLQATSMTSAVVTESATVGTTLGVTGKVTAGTNTNAATVDQFQVYGLSTLSGNATVSGTLGVAGATTLTGGVSTGAASSSTLHATTLNGTTSTDALTVGGAATFNSSLLANQGLTVPTTKTATLANVSVSQSLVMSGGTATLQDVSVSASGGSAEDALTISSGRINAGGIDGVQLILTQTGSGLTALNVMAGRTYLRQTDLTGTLTVVGTVDATSGTFETLTIASTTVDDEVAEAERVVHVSRGTTRVRALEVDLASTLHDVTVQTSLEVDGASTLNGLVTVSDGNNFVMANGTMDLDNAVDATTTLSVVGSGVGSDVVTIHTNGEGSSALVVTGDQANITVASITATSTGSKALTLTS
ncbi:MAG: hypothetical protein VXY56_06955, partial [Pseudomonadota bacterium]|nr:hypothetical protein [Pseudomonadota bacterium]